MILLPQQPLLQTWDYQSAHWAIEQILCYSIFNTLCITYFENVH